MSTQVMLDLYLSSQINDSAVCRAQSVRPSIWVDSQVSFIIYMEANHLYPLVQMEGSKN